jgi:dihydroceramidase
MQAYYESFLGGPASIDWCEPNYSVSPYIAEFWNTMSSLVMALIAGYSLVWKYRQHREVGYLVLEVMIIIIGLGSALFHGTLTFYGQLADELPMIWASFVLAFLTWHAEKSKTDRLFVAFLVALGVCWTAVSRFIHFSHNWIFEVFFALMMFFTILVLIRLVRRSRSPWSMWLLVVYIALGVGSFVLWNLDQIFCRNLLPVYVALPHLSSLHGWWHVGMSLFS